MNKKYFVPVGAIAFASIVMLGATVSFAQATTTTNPETTLVQRIAQKFGLEEEKVQAVVDEVHTERHAQMQKNLEAKLTQAVVNGKITEGQKAAIVAKSTEMKAKKADINREAFRNMTEDERKAHKDAKEAELKTWVESNGLSLETLKDLMIFKGHKGAGMRMH